MEIRFPIGGLNEIGPRSDPDADHSYDETNMRSRVPSSQEVVGGSRPGLVDVATFTGRVDRIQTVVYDGRRISYSAGVGVEEWHFTPTAGGAIVDGVADSQENIYFLDGTHSITKLNKHGEKQWTLKLPTTDPAHVVRAICGNDQGSIFAAVSAGGDQKKGRIWRFLQRDATEPELAWTDTDGKAAALEIDGYCERILLRSDYLITAQNYPDRWGSAIVAYSGALTSGPIEAWRKVVSYPINDAALNAAGDVFFVSPPFANRGLDPRFPNFTERTLDAALKDIWGADFEKRRWSDIDPATLTDLDDLDAVDLLEDQSGNERDLFTSIRSAATNPVYSKAGANGLPCVRFRGLTDELQSARNPSTDTPHADQQRTPVPGYKGAKFVTFIVFRPQLLPANVTPQQQAVFSYLLSPDGTGGPGPDGNNDLKLFVNRDSAGGRRGALFVKAGADPVHPGASGLSTSDPIHGFYDFVAGDTNHPNNCGIVVATLIWDSGKDPTDDTKLHCQLHINGKPIDRWVGSNSVMRGPFYLGAAFDDGGAGPSSTSHFEGEFYRQITFADYSTYANGLASGFNYPRTTGTIPGTSVATTWTSGDGGEIEKTEALLLHYYGASHTSPVLPASPPVLLAGPLYNPGNFPFPYPRRYGPPRASGVYVERSEPYRLHSPMGILAKIDGSRGDLQWVLTSSDSGNDNGVGGVGYSVACVGDYVFTLGPKQLAGTFPLAGYSADSTDLRLTVDRPGGKGIAGYYGAFTGSAQGAWAVQIDPGTMTYTYPRLAVDSFQNVYVPYCFDTGTYSMLVYARDGGGNQILAFTATGNAPGRAVIVERKSPAYRIGDTAGNDFRTTSLADADIPRAESVFLLNALGTVDRYAARRLRLVESTVLQVSSRAVATVVVNAGKVEMASGTLTGLASPQLDTTPRYVASATLFGSVYLLDGRTRLKVDPKAMTVAEWTAKKGQAPKRTSLLVNWRGRAVEAGSYDDPHQWFMWKQGDPEDFDTQPVPFNARMAVSGVDSRIGGCPDKIQCVFPYSDDTLFFFGASTVYVVERDPADPQSGADFRMVTDATGSSFGNPVCMDPFGVVYFHGKQVFRMAPRSKPEPMTLNRIPKRIADIDTETYRVEMHWDDEFDGMHLVLIPWGTVTAMPEHYFWERLVDAWHPESFASLGLQPTCVGYIDGTGMVIGCNDGTVRRFSSTARNDDGVAFESKVMIGPMAPKDTRRQFRFINPTVVLNSSLDSANIRLFVSQDPRFPGLPVKVWPAAAGRNPRKMVGGKGSYVWLEIQQYALNKAWAFEAASVDAASAGRAYA